MSLPSRPTPLSTVVRKWMFPPPNTGLNRTHGYSPPYFLSWVAILPNRSVSGQPRPFWAGWSPSRIRTSSRWT